MTKISELFMHLVLQKNCGFKRKETKSRSQSNELYTPLNVPNKPWTNISMKFVLGCMLLIYSLSSLWI